MNRPDLTGQLDWMRLSPVGIGYFIINFAVRFSKRWVQSLLPALAVFIASVHNKVFWLSLLIPVMLVSLVVFAALYWWHFRFCLDGEKLRVEQGILHKKQLQLAFSRVQNVNIRIPFYFQPFNLVNCVFDSAGSSKAEVNLPGVSATYADTLRQAVFAADHSPQTQQTQNMASSATAEPAPVVALTNRDLIRYGIYNPTWLVVIAALVPFRKSLSEFIEARVLPTAEQYLHGIISNSQHLHQLATIALFAVAGVLLICGSIVVTWVRFYRLRLVLEHGRVHRYCGLLERQHSVMNQEKIQTLVVTQNMLARLLGRVNVALLQYVSSQRQGGGQKTLMVPALRMKPALNLASTLLGTLPQETWHGVHSAYWWRTLLLYWLPLVGLATLILTINSREGMWLITLLIPIAALLYSRYRQGGLQFDDNFALFRQGMLGRRISIVALTKVQQVRLSQSPGQRRLQVANISLVTASGRISLPYVPLSVANQLINRALYRVETCGISWN